MADRGVKLIVTGLPGTNKAEVARILAEQYDAVLVSVKAELTAAVEESANSNHKMGAIAARYMKDGMLVPDEVVSSIVVDAIKRAELASQSWVLVGGPRSPGQAQTLIAEGIRPNLLVWLQREDDEILAELAARGHPPVVADMMLTAGRANKSKVLAFFPDIVREMNGSLANEELCQEIQRTASEGLQQSLVVVVGGPRSGKGALCERVARDRTNEYDVLSMESLIRNAAATDNQLSTYLLTGNPVPTVVLVNLVKAAMEASNGKNFIVGDLLGFGRYATVVADLVEWYSLMAAEGIVVNMVVHLECSDGFIREKVAADGEFNATETNFENRLKTYRETIAPELDRIASFGTLRSVAAGTSADVVFARVSRLLRGLTFTSSPLRKVVAFPKALVDDIATLIGGAQAKAGARVSLLNQLLKELSFDTSVIAYRTLAVDQDGLAALYRLDSSNAADASFAGNLAGFVIPQGETKGMVYVAMVEAPFSGWSPQRRDGANWAKGVDPAKLAPLGARVVDRLVYCSSDRASAAADVGAWFCSGFGDIFNPTTFVKPSRTLAIIKPMCASLHMGGIRAVLGSQGFTVAREMQLHMTTDQVSAFFSKTASGSLLGNDEYDVLLDSLTGDVSTVMVLERVCAVAHLNYLLGPSDEIGQARAAELAMPALRTRFGAGIFGVGGGFHASASQGDAVHEIKFFFPDAFALRPSTQARKRINRSTEDAYEYMKKRVDPIMGPLVQRVITERPEDVSLFALRELRSHRNSTMGHDSSSQSRSMGGSGPVGGRSMRMPTIVNKVMEKEGISKSTRNLRSLETVPDQDTSASAVSKPTPAPAAPVVAAPAPKPSPPPQKELTAEEIEMLDGVALPDDIDDAHDEILRLHRQVEHLSDQLHRQRNQISVRDGDAIKTLTILHFNDIYAYEAGPKEPVGGASRLSSLCKSFADENPLIINSGDVLGPSITSNCTHGSHMIEILNLIGVHYGCLGNHDFDFGLVSTTRQLKMSSTTWLISNIVDPTTKQPVCGCQRKALVTWNGIRVGMMGIVEDWLSMCSKVLPHEVEYQDMFEVAASLRDELRADGAQVIIAITHCRTVVDEELADKVPGIDLILGGHDHFYSTYESAATTVPMVKSGCDFRDLTKIQIKFNTMAEPGTPSPSGVDKSLGVKIKWPPLRIPVLSKISLDPQVDTVVKHFEEVVEKKMSKPIGFVDEDLDSRCVIVRTQESSLANLITDIFRNVYKADVCVLNGGCIRSDSCVPKGQVTIKTISTFFPFEDVVMFLKLSGADVLYCLENGVSRAPAQDGRFCHVSGIRFKYDPSKPEKRRVVEATVNGEPLDLQRMYTLATNGFLSKGKEGYKPLAKAEHLIDDEFATTVQASLLDYFLATQKPGTEEFETITPKLEGRIEVVDGFDGPSLSDSVRGGGLSSMASM